MTELSSVQTALIGLPARAERDRHERLIETFVDAEPLLTLLKSENHQIIFGRRGTGKTHALKVLGDWAASRGDIALFVDLRTIGSNGSIYTDQSLSLSERATRLLVDVVRTLYDELLEYATSASAVITPGTNPFDQFKELENALSQVRVVSTTEVDVNDRKSVQTSSAVNTTLDTEPHAARIRLGAEARTAEEAERLTGTRQSGEASYYVQFPTLHDTFRNLLQALGVDRLWILLDEWSEVPTDLQPYLADLFRRSLIPIASISIKIAAIEHRTNFIIHGNAGHYIGFEIGADAAADINLDDFMVFDNDAERARAFFANLFYKHFVTTPQASSDISSPEQFIGQLFTQSRVFDELVKAAEGVPRDGIYLLSKITQKAFGSRISMDHLQQGARDWYQQDKYALVRQDERLSKLLEKIIEEVIGHRRSRAFLFRAGLRNPLIERLFDGRLLHILKRGRSSHDQPGVRYDVYKIDYGCYVELLRTTRSPLGLFADDEGNYYDVPPDDYRSVRRAILRPEDVDV